MTAHDLAAALARGLSEAGVTHIFGVPGGGPNLDMIGAAERLGIEFVLTHQESAACIAAASHGLATGTPGVAVVTRGPGLTSALNGLAQATLDRAPLLLISDTVTRATADRVAHQRLDQVATAAPVAKWSGTLGTHDPAAVVSAAAALAMAGPAGGVHLAFDPTTPGDAPPPLSVCAPTPATELQRARDLVSAASHPVVIVGLDAARYADDVRAALTGLEVPILTTYQAKGVVPHTWATYAGLFTGATIERPLLQQADVVIGIGLDPVEPLLGRWDYAAPVVMLHSHPVETGYFGDPLVVVGDYATDLPALLAGVAPAWSPGTGREIRLRDLASLEWASDLLTPHEVVTITRDALPEALLTVDAGAHMLVAMPLWETDEARSVHISNGLATMGFSLPAAIGLALAHPGRRVACFVGDGGLGMTLAELETVARLQVPITVVVFNDASLSLIRLKQGEGQGGARATDYSVIDFAVVAAGLGLPAEVVTSAEELKGLLGRPTMGPILVDARVDAGAYPHVIGRIRG